MVAVKLIYLNMRNIG